jgi:ABC-type multidrug transport system fused ATPase/permease subunit
MLTYQQILKTYAQLHPANVTGTLALAAILPIESLLTPKFMGGFGAGIANLDTKKTTESLFGLAGLNLLTAISHEVDKFVIADTSTSMRAHVCSEVIRQRLLREKNEISEDINNASAIHQINSLSNAFVFYNRYLLNVIPAAISLLVQTIYMFKTDGILASCLGAMLACAIGLTIGAHSGCRNVLIAENEDRGELTEALDEILTHRLSIIEAGKIDEEVYNLRGKANIARKSTNRAISKSTIFTVSLSILTVVACLIFLVRLNRILKTKRDILGTTKLVEIGTSSLSTLLRAFDNINRINNNIFNLAQKYNELVHLLNIVNRGKYVDEDGKLEEEEEKEEKEEKEEEESVVVLEKTDVFLQLKNVCFSYKSGDEILKNFNIEFKNGQTHIITGAVGGGKSTVLKILAGLVKPKTGVVLLNGENIINNKASIGYIPQRARLFSRSLYENIIYGNDNITRKNVEEFLEKHNINFGKDLNDTVGKNGSLLSGGQRQLVLLLRLLFRDTFIMLLDEPSASVDTKIRVKMVSLLTDAVKSGKTIIVITHDVEFMTLLKKEGAILHVLEGEKKQNKQSDFN